MVRTHNAPACCIHTYILSLNRSLEPQITWPVMALTDMRALKLRPCLKFEMDVNLLLGWARITCPTRYSQTGRLFDWCLFTLKGCVGVVRWHERRFYVWNSEFGSASSVISSCGTRNCGRLMAPMAHAIRCKTHCSVDLLNFDDNSSLNRMATACIDMTSWAPLSNHTATTNTRNRAWTFVIATLCEKSVEK